MDLSMKNSIQGPFLNYMVYYLRALDKDEANATLAFSKG